MGQRSGNRSPDRRAPRAVRASFALAGLLAAVVLSSPSLDAQPPAESKKPADPKGPPSAKEPPKSSGIKLPDGTYLWTGPTAPAGEGGERVVVPPQEYQKLVEQVEQLRKQLTARRPAPPSGCALKAKVEKRGEASVAVVEVTYRFRTTAANAAVLLGGRRAFLVAAALDGDTLPILDTGDDGFAALVESPGDHTLKLHLETPIAGRGVKAEVGFEIGLPRAPITTLALTPPGPAVKRVTLTTRTPDPTRPAGPGEAPRRLAVGVEQLAAKPDGGGYPLGPVDLLEVAWEPPPTAAVPPDPVRSAAFDIACEIREGFVETTAKVRLHGPGAEWRLAAPPNATVTVEPAAGTAKEATRTPTVTREPDRPVWKIDIPEGSAADWEVTAVARQLRPKSPDPKSRGPFSVGPFAVLGVAQQTGTVKVIAPAYTRLGFKYGPDLRREAPATPDENATTALFRLATGPVGTNPPPGAMLTVEATALSGRVQVRPSYKLTLTEPGWRVRVELQVTPIRTEVSALTVEVPAEWRSLEPSPPDVVEGLQPLKSDGPRQLVSVRLAAVHRQPFDLVLEAAVPVAPTAQSGSVPLARFPGSFERDARITVTVPDGQEVRGSAREWEGDQPAGWGQPLAPVAGPDGRPPKAPATITGRFEHGLARADLSWHPYQPEVTAEVRAEVTVHDRSVGVVETVTLRSPDGFGRGIRFRVPAGAVGLRTPPGLEPRGPGEWHLPAGDGKEQTLRFSYSVARPARPPEDRGPWKVPVGLCWPAGTTRTDTTVRVVSHLDRNLAVSADPAVWRELPPETTADAEPALILAGSGADLPLVLEVRPVPGADAVRVERALIQAWARDDGVTEYRARFRLAGWVAGSVDVRLPGPLTGTSPVLTVDGRPADVTELPDPEEPTRGLLRVRLPADRRSAVLDVQYAVASARQSGGESVFAPPQLLGAGFARTVRWQVNVPSGALPLVPGDAARVESRWRWRFGLAPVAGHSAEYLERWFQAAVRADDDPTAGEPGDATAVLIGQAEPRPLRVYRVSAVRFTMLCSVAVLVIGLLLTRLRAAWLGPAVVVLVATAACAAVLAPQPAAQVAAAGQFGLLALAAALAVQAAVRWSYRRRVTYLPGFARTRPESAPSAASGGAIRGRSSANGSTGSVTPAEPAAPSGS